MTGREAVAALIAAVVPLAASAQQCVEAQSHKDSAGAVAAYYVPALAACNAHLKTALEDH